VASDQVASLRTSVDTARESLRLTRLRYSNGEALALEVVDAQSALAQAEAALADGILRSHVARANLQTLTGILR
jgi:outer membrane protein TolC